MSSDSKQSILVRWFISYATVLMIPLLISLVMYSVSIRVVEKQTLHSNESLLREIQGAFDNRLVSLKQLSTTLALDPKIASLKQSGELSPSQQYTAMTIVKELQGYKLANDFIEEIFIYYGVNELVLSSRYRIDGELLRESLRASSSEADDQWLLDARQAYPLGFSKMEYRPVYSSHAFEDAIIYMSPLTMAAGEEDAVFVFFVIRQSHLLASVDLDAGNTMLILDEFSKVVASEPDMDQLSEAWGAADMKHDHGILYKDFRGEKAVISYITSRVTGWKYVSIVNKRHFAKQMAYIQRLTMISVLLCLLIGGLAVVWLIRSNYNPIQRLVQLLSAKGNVTAPDANELKFIEHVVERSWAEKEQVQQQMKQHSNTLRAYALLRLLKGQLGYKIPLRDLLHVHEVRFPHPVFAVVLIKLEQLGQFNDRSIAHFIAGNVMEEQIRGYAEAYSVEVDDMLAFLVNMPEAPLQQLAAQLEHKLGEGREFLQDKMKIEFTAAVSGFHTRLEQVSTAYTEALEALEYGMLIETDGTVVYSHSLPEEADESKEYYYFPLVVEQQLINFIKLGDFEQARSLITDIFSRNTLELPMSLPMARCLSQDLTAMFLKSFHEINGAVGKRLMEELMFMDRMSQARSIREIQAEAVAVLKEACGIISEERGTGSRELGQSIKQYIEMHYADSNLNVSAIGHLFGITPWYISKLFKEMEGEGLLDYLHRVRISEAKRLLADGQLTLSEIASRIGYNDTNTFSRVFKKWEGITPGKYRS